MSNVNAKEQKYKKTIVALSIILPLAVAALFGVNLRRMGFDIEPLNFLPPIYASINGATALVLILAVVAIKNGKRKQHEKLMKTAILFSVLFLLMYVAYHITSDTTYFGDANRDGVLSETEKAATGSARGIYFFILITHILLSIAIIPMVLFTYVKGISGNFESHRKWAKITFPVWLYVAVTGVVVYFMIAPYYPI